MMGENTTAGELGEALVGPFRHGAAQPPQDPVGPGVDEQPELIGHGPGAGGSVGREMDFPGLDVVFGRSAPTVDLAA